MRMSIALATATVFFITVPAFAQTNAGDSSSTVRTTSTPPAVANPNNTDKTMAAPVPGKSSFTKSEVEKRLNDHGYSQVARLMQDDKSIWHGNAVKAGQTVNVAVDYQGNITER